jgi:hypothetical protein
VEPRYPLDGSFDGFFVWAVEPIDAGVVRLDHLGFATVDDMFRIVTLVAPMLLSLRDYLASGVRKPFFHC